MSAGYVEVPESQMERVRAALARLMAVVEKLEREAGLEPPPEDRDGG